MIRNFQQRVLNMKSPDGVIEPKGPTLRRLLAHGLPLQKGKPLAAALPIVAKRTAKAPSTTTSWGVISEEEYVDAAWRLGCEAAAVKAVVETEVGIRSPFDAQKRPTILFERHVFSRLTNGKFDKDHADISNRDPGQYGRFNEQYDRMERAAKLDSKAAPMSASWGAFQIMGKNYQQAGFESMDAFVAAMKSSIQDQVDAFVTFCSKDPRLKKALQDKDWSTFARIYNGPTYKKNSYDSKMKLNYEKFLKGG